MGTTLSHTTPAPTSPLTRFYLRRSLDDEKQQASLETQRLVCGRFVATRPDFPSEIVTYTDEKRSGDDFTRPGLVALLSSVRRGDIVVAYDDSRLGRDALLVALVIRQIARDKGARVFYAATGTEAKSADFADDIVNVARGAGAEGELAKIRQRTRDGVRARILSGHYSGFPPYGYKLIPDDSTRDAAGNCKKWIRVDESKADAVRRIFTEYSAGKGCQSIAVGLRADGISPPRGGVWVAGKVRDILSHPIYRGVVIYGATRTIRRNGKHVATEKVDPSTVIRQSRPELRIIPDELADRVDAALAARATAPRVRHVVHPLSGWARCGRCGGSIATYASARYICDRWRRTGECDSRIRYPIPIVEGAIVEGLLTQVLSDDVLAMARAGVRAALEAEAARLRAIRGADTAAMEAELTALRQRKDRAVKLALATDDDADVIASLRDIKERIATIEGQIAAARSALDLDDMTLRRIEADAMERLERTRDMVRDRTRLRAALSDLFPERLTFHPVADLDGEGWLIAGDAAPIPACTLAGGTSEPR